MSIRDDKAALRRLAKATLGALTPSERADASRLICERLLTLPHIAAATDVLIYAPLASEPDLSDFATRAITNGLRVYIPRVDWDRGTMDAARILNWPADLIDGSNGLREAPLSAPHAAPDAIDAVLIPGLAFDARGGRLGRGAGFYDRFLTPIPQNRRIGVCFASTLVPAVPSEPHDARMGLVVTERGTYPDPPSDGQGPSDS